MNNRIHTCTNPYQGEYKRVLCVCSAGLLRSPTAAMVLSQEPYNFNTRAAGLESNYALIPVDDVLLHWADEVVCMTPEQEELLTTSLKLLGKGTRVTCLNIQDNFAYRDPKLVEAIQISYDKAHAADV